ncbi:MAG TPA: DedA family protein [Syntrophorhabdaceae bacterium]|nr:DedA family protein [Syntrophorhabdaceae bacterium]
MSLETIISTFGYPAVLLGTFVEGETVLILAGFLAHQHYMSLPAVMICAFIGSFVSDQLYFYIGYLKGQKIIKKRKEWIKASGKISSLFQRHSSLVILGFRFALGFRMITPLILGATNVSPLYFLILNLMSAALWAVVVSSLGFAFGRAIEAIIGDIKKYELLLIISLATAGCVVWIVRWFRVRAKASSLAVNSE